MPIRKPLFPPITFTITDIKVVDIQREKIDITVLAKVIFEKTAGGAFLPPDERRLVEPFLDPAYTTDDAPLLERFLVVYEKTKAGTYLSPAAAPIRPADPAPGNTEADEGDSNVAGRGGLSI